MFVERRQKQNSCPLKSHDFNDIIHLKTTHGTNKINPWSLGETSIEPPVCGFQPLVFEGVYVVSSIFFHSPPYNGSRSRDVLRWPTSSQAGYTRNLYIHQKAIVGIETQGVFKGGQYVRQKAMDIFGELLYGDWWFFHICFCFFWCCLGHLNIPSGAFCDEGFQRATGLCTQLDATSHGGSALYAISGTTKCAATSGYPVTTATRLG